MALILLIDIVVVLSLVMASRRRLEDALPIFCFFLVLIPFESRFVVPGLFDLSTERVALLTLLILFLTRRERIGSSKIPLKYLMFLQIGWALCSTCYSLSVATSAKQIIAQLEYYLVYYIFLRIISDMRTIHKIVYAMVMAIAVCSIFGFFETYNSWSILRVFPANLWTTYNGGLDPLYVEAGRGIRVRSTFPHPILFGDALAMSIPLTFYLLSIWKNKRQRFVLWVSLMLMFWAVYKTSSRGPWIATGISLFLLFLLVNNRVRKYLAGMALSSLIVLVARPGIWQTIANLYASTTDSSSPVGTSYMYRSALMDAIVHAVGKDPLRAILGYGLGTFRELGLDINFLNSVQHWYTCDNNWAAFLYETGYVGLFIMGSLLFTILLMSLRNYQRLPRPERYFSGVLLISLAGFYFLLLSAAGYSWGQQSFMAWILISLSVVYPRIALRDRHKKAISKAALKLHTKVPGTFTVLAEAEA